jgi:ActR/RegA family two-component response regulator
MWIVGVVVIAACVAAIFLGGGDDLRKPRNENELL